MDIAEELKKPEGAAVAGAIGGLVAATIVPAWVILSLGALTAGGVYLYNWINDQEPDAAKGSGDTPNTAPENGGKDN